MSTDIYFSWLHSHSQHRTHNSNAMPPLLFICDKIWLLVQPLLLVNSLLITKKKWKRMEFDPRSVCFVAIKHVQKNVIKIIVTWCVCVIKNVYWIEKCSWHDMEIEHQPRWGYWSTLKTSPLSSQTSTHSTFSDFWLLICWLLTFDYFLTIFWLTLSSKTSTHMNENYFPFKTE